ncbi:protein phosphatase 2C domain-containing protein [Dactylosporangium sp. AC04546]|uniref:PP2C family protein-serine/threonine phosphatase n=1 Tax=Dactylosporangium sp. AC04546 TaxID=2862460 RepID=UPI001EDE23BF|nr:protein phosphatase 2C domain-containing protein [Dactylosporangium sp. AC04546]WVK83308.1 protein phosphatase 2C domain-containing protein [Dactylosporangium sp. AC04546]
MACVRCGGTVAPDGYCWDCGHAQPLHRARLEISIDGAGAVTDRGLRRGVNADAMALTTAGPWTIGVVTDGISMTPRPERAAQVAAACGAERLAARLTAGALPEEALEDAAVRAGAAVAALNGPGCTYVAGIAGPAGIWATGVGDSRAYWLPSSGPGMALTDDDTGALDTISAWLGAGAPPPRPQVHSHRPHVPGTLLLCTDGLWRYLPSADDLRVRLRGPAPLDDARTLVGHALAAGGRDNITALVIAAISSPPTAGT